ncbi:MAG: hypothetical protein MJ078_07460 [Clostridia bacterium]|nr:hypothetical protein [Clostridia bacterium]
MAETVNQETGAPTAEQSGKTFTQEELNAIVADRLNREREKYAGFEDYKAKAAKFDAAEEAAKSDLQRAQEEAGRYKAQAEALQREIGTRNAREKIAAEKGIPANLLTGETEEDCAKQADAILAWRGGNQKYPAVQDSGETGKLSGGKTRDQFANWVAETLKK